MFSYIFYIVGVLYQVFFSFFTNKTNKGEKLARIFTLNNFLMANFFIGGKKTYFRLFKNWRRGDGLNQWFSTTGR